MPNQVINIVRETLKWGTKAFVFGGVGTLIVDNILRRVTFPIIQKGSKALGEIQTRTFLVLGSFPIATAIAVYHLAQETMSHSNWINRHPKLTHRIIIVISFLSGAGTVIGCRFILSVPLIQAVFVSVTGAVLSFSIPYYVNKLIHSSQKTLSTQNEDLGSLPKTNNSPVKQIPEDVSELIDEKHSKADQGTINEKQVHLPATNLPIKPIQEDVSELIDEEPSKTDHEVINEKQASLPATSSPVEQTQEDVSELTNEEPAEAKTEEIMPQPNIKPASSLETHHLTLKIRWEDLGKIFEASQGGLEKILPEIKKKIASPEVNNFTLIVKLSIGVIRLLNNSIQDQDIDNHSSILKFLEEIRDDQKIQKGESHKELESSYEKSKFNLKTNHEDLKKTIEASKTEVDKMPNERNESFLKKNNLACLVKLSAIAKQLLDHVTNQEEIYIDHSKRLIALEEKKGSRKLQKTAPLKKNNDKPLPETNHSALQARVEDFIKMIDTKASQAGVAKIETNEKLASFLNKNNSDLIKELFDLFKFFAQIVPQINAQREIYKEHSIRLKVLEDA